MQSSAWDGSMRKLQRQVITLDSKCTTGSKTREASPTSLTLEATELKSVLVKMPAVQNTFKRTPTRFGRTIFWLCPSVGRPEPIDLYERGGQLTCDILLKNFHWFLPRLAKPSFQFLWPVCFRRPSCYLAFSQQVALSFPIRTARLPFLSAKVSCLPFWL
jgi:hypothetical protein